MHSAGNTPHDFRADNLAAFRGLVSSSFVPLKITAENSQAFNAKLAQTDGDDVIFTEVQAVPHLVERTPETIARGGSGYYKVSLLLEGTSILVQDGKETVMRPGDLSVYDTSRPYSLLFGENFRNLIMMFPKDRLNLPSRFTEQLMAEPLLKQHEALSRVLTNFLSQFPQQMLQLSEPLRGKLAHTSLDLLSTLFAAILDADPVQRDPHQLLLHRIYEYIIDNLASHELTPSAIAAAHFISTRHLHALFQESGTTVSTWIRERRLEKCRLDLMNPGLQSRPVAAIAAAWGFSDAAHFSRAFKNAYDFSPSALRQHYLAIG